MNFQSVVINVSDLDRSIEFYVDVFGFTVLSKRDRLAALSAPGSERPQVLVLRAFGTSGRSAGGGHIGIRAFVLEVGATELEQIEKALERRKSLAQRITDHATWKGVVAHDPDRMAVVVGSAIGSAQIGNESWAALHESLYGLGE
jgi:catechol 2,3-dioxygenase-like lactoylglutathione lyase family enzyme